MATHADMDAWYTALYGGMQPGHFIEQRYLKADRTRTFSPTIADAMAHAQRHRDLSSVYPGMALRGPRENGGGKDNCLATNVLWVDVDLKLCADALERLTSFGLPFSIIVNSGGGYHGQILLDGLLDVSEDVMKERVEAINHHLIAAVGGDVTLDNVGDLPRILRAPGTINHKYDPARPVTLVHLDTSLRYGLAEVEGYLRARYPVPAAPVVRAPAAARPTPPVHRVASRALDADVVPSWVDWQQSAPEWPQILEADGWQFSHAKGDEEFWVRPGKTRRDGHGASLNYAALDRLFVWTSSVPGLEEQRTYTKWQYLVFRRYGGDFHAAARGVAEEGYGTIGRYACSHGLSLAEAASALEAQRAVRQGPQTLRPAPMPQASLLVHVTPPQGAVLRVEVA